MSKILVYDNIFGNYLRVFSYLNIAFCVEIDSDALIRVVVAAKHYDDNNHTTSFLTHTDDPFTNEVCSQNLNCV